MDCLEHSFDPSLVAEQKAMPEMISYDQAQELLSDLAKKLSLQNKETIPLAQACGRILAEDLFANSPRPEADISAMDGYAFCCADITITDKHTGTIPLQDYIVAGDQPLPLWKGTAATILTGARLPAGADCVIARERTQLKDDLLSLNLVDIAPGKNIRRLGEEFIAGTHLLNAGQKLDWRHLVLLASQKVQQLSVYKPLTIGIIANGAEFSHSAQDCRTELNTLLLGSMLENLGIQTINSVVRSDSKHDLEKAILDMVEQSDILLTTGGISVGQTDHVLPVLESLGANGLFRRVKIRPGKPFTVMQLGTKPVFCLPGNTGAAAICTQFFIIPFLLSVLTRKTQSTTSGTLSGISNFSLMPPTDTTCFVPVTLLQKGDERVLSLVPSHGASDILCFSQSAGILRIPAGHPLNAGDRCHARPF